MIFLKSTDIFIDYPNIAYHLFYNEETAVIDGIGLYLNVWIQNYLGLLYSEPPVPKLKIYVIRTL